MNIKEIASVAELMTKHDLTEFIIESEELKLIIKRGSEQQGEMGAPAYFPQQMPMAAAAQPAAPAAAPAQGTPASEEKPAEKTGPVVTSPIVGTFYAAPSPGADSFVKVGDEVQEDTVVCIVEAMKVMNEIKAEKRGRIKKVLVENANPVEFGQPLFELEEI